MQGATKRYQPTFLIKPPFTPWTTWEANKLPLTPVPWLYLAPKAKTGISSLALRRHLGELPTHRLPFRTKIMQAIEKTWIAIPQKGAAG